MPGVACLRADTTRLVWKGPASRLAVTESTKQRATDGWITRYLGLGAASGWDQDSATARELRHSIEQDEACSRAQADEQASSSSRSDGTEITRRSGPLMCPRDGMIQKRSEKDGLGELK